MGERRKAGEGRRSADRRIKEGMRRSKKKS